jgi:mevalonate kinase
MALGTANGKILLFGEHAAVYGHPALGMTLDLETSVEFTGGPGPIIVEGVAPQHIIKVEQLVRVLGASLGLAPGSVDGCYRIHSSIPPGGGLGSSAALSAATAGAIAAEHSLRPSIHALWETANAGERLFHGTPSGIDTGLAIRTGLTSFVAGPHELPEARQLQGLEAVLLVATSPRTGSTESLVGSFRQRMASGDPDLVAAMGALGGQAREAIHILASHDADPGGSLGKLADEAHVVLAELGLSTPEIDLFLRTGARSGSLGGKMSGAGGGGACFLLYPDRAAANKSQQALDELICSHGLSLAIQGTYPLG